MTRAPTTLTRPRRRWTALCLLGLAGCTIEVAPSVPSPTRRARVVAAAPAHQGAIDVDEARCPGLCPPAAAGEALDTCHGTALSPELHAHRQALNEPPALWIVCHYEED